MRLKLRASWPGAGCSRSLGLGLGGGFPAPALGCRRCASQQLLTLGLAERLRLLTFRQTCVFLTVGNVQPEATLTHFYSGTFEAPHHTRRLRPPLGLDQLQRPGERD